jgi:hypothetical protein
MKAVTNFHPEYGKEGYDFSLLGELVHEIDESESYEEDEAKLFKNQRKYTLIAASGCSCWDGDWEGWTDLTKTELKKLGVSWSKDEYGASKSMGEWITENIK